MVTATPGMEKSTHHIVLTDGVNSLGLVLTDGQGRANPRNFRRDPLPRNSLKIYTAEQKPSDMEPPWQPIAQTDWSGGRGQEDFGIDSSRYYDAQSAYTLRGNKMFNGPSAIFGYGHRKLGIRKDICYYSLGSQDGVFAYAYAASTAYLAGMFTPDANFTASHIEVKLIVLDGGMTYDVAIYSNNSGSPGTLITNNGDLITDPGIYTVDVQIADTALTSGTPYWLVINYDGGHVMMNESATASEGKSSSDASTWYQLGFTPYFRVMPDDVGVTHFFAEYKGALFMGAAYDDGSASKVFLNGEQGIATSGTTSTLVDSTKSWGTNEWANCVVKIVAGTGSDANSNWGVILTNTGTTLNIHGLDIAPDATSEYVILGSQKWTEITGHTMSGKITDVLSVNNILYFAMGDGEDIHRMRRYNSSGWTTEWVKETGNTAYLLKDAADKDGMQIWKADRSGATVAKASAVNGSGSGAVSNLSFGSDVVVGDVSERINGITVYGEYGNLWVLKAGTIWQIIDDKAYYVAITEMQNTDDDRNGKANLMQGVYMYFSWENGLERYYASALDDIGPNRDEGLSYLRRGPISHLVGYPGQVIAAIDGTSVSSVMSYNALGWHELYRSSSSKRIRRLHIQPIPGDHVNRLWVSVGDDVCWLSIDVDPLSANYSRNYYRHSPVYEIESSKIYAGLMNVNKWYANVEGIFEGLPYTTSGHAHVFYRVGDSTEEDWRNINWTYAGAMDYNTTQVEIGVTGKWIQIKLLVVSGNWYGYGIPLVAEFSALISDTLTRLPIKYSTSIQFRVFDRDKDIAGNDDQQGTAAEKFTILDGWEAAASPLTMSSQWNILDGKTVFLEAGSVRAQKIVTDDGEEGYIVTAMLIEAS